MGESVVRAIRDSRVPISTALNRTGNPVGPDTKFRKNLKRLDSFPRLEVYDPTSGPGCSTGLSVNCLFIMVYISSGSAPRHRAAGGWGSAPLRQRTADVDSEQMVRG